MTLLDKVVRAMERIAPLKLAETTWDNVGTLLEAPLPRPGATRVFLTNDLTAPVLDEAQKDPAVGVIVAYHPFLFSSFKRITLANPKQAIALRCAAAGISVYSPHTALDSCVNGVNDWLASGLGAGTVSAITPRDDIIEDQVGAGQGRILRLDTPVSLTTLVDRVKAHLKLNHLRLATAPRHKTELISSVAICAGSGNSVVSSIDADLYLTGEMGHHEALAAIERQTSVILCEHSNTERGYLHSVLATRLQNVLKEQGMEDASVVCSQIDQDPLQIV
ncbi:GTP cyclohydrolase 1 type 2/Nif3 [Syncephalis plumigaleata]|nr:GTP cyclohydrolase 1 type 2/Nif3 [Syncephalis plumigaleata]